MKFSCFVYIAVLCGANSVKCLNDLTDRSGHGYSPPQARNVILEDLQTKDSTGTFVQSSSDHHQASHNHEGVRDESYHNQIQYPPISSALASRPNISDHGSGHGTGHGTGHETGHGNGHEGGVHLASWRWSEYSSAIMFTGMILVAAILKIIFHHLTWLSKILPESCVLIVVGIFVALIIHYVILDDFVQDGHESKIPFPKFTSDLFFNVLLPPIILDSALSLYDRDFFDNFFSIMIFAVFGTLLNVFSIGYSLYGLSYSGALGNFVSNKTGVPLMYELKPTECLIFSSLISAVDPVAVLAIFEEIHVHMGLYFLVFGESLFNDGVTVVLYNTMNTLLSVSNVGIVETVMAILSFFFVAFGGAIIGAMNGIFASYITTFTKHVQVVEPLIIFSTAYIAFLTAELVHWSGIISIIAYGITIKRYGLQNLGRDSFTTVKFAIKTLASTSDCIIFLFLGIVLFQLEHNFHVGFILATILLCLFFRFLWTFALSWMVNLRRVHKIVFKEQIIMGYGGLRGAVGFSLAVVLDDKVWYKELFLSAALAMVFFTVFLQGSTIKLLVKCLNIKLSDEKEPLISHDLQSCVMDEIMEGIEIILGNKNKATGFCQNFFGFVDKSLRTALITEDKQQILHNYEKIMLDEHFTNLYAPRIIVEQQEKATKPAPLSKTASRRTLKKGIKNSNWDKFRNAWEADNSDLRSIADQLEMRRKRSQAMGDQVLEHHEETNFMDMLDGYEENGNTRVSSPVRKDAYRTAPPRVERSASANWGALRRASKRTMSMKQEYDKIRSTKYSGQHRSDPSPPVPSILEEPESSEREAFLRQ